MQLGKLLTDIGEWFALAVLVVVVVLAAVAFVSQCTHKMAYGAEPGFELNVPEGMTLTGSLLRGPMDTATPYLKYYWLEAICEGKDTAFIILYDVECNRSVIGFVHHAGLPDSKGNFETWAVYYCWNLQGEIKELGDNRALVDAYLADYKASKKFSKRWKKKSFLDDSGYSQTLAATPFGEILVILPKGVPFGLYDKDHRGKICWESDRFQALCRYQDGARYFLIMDVRMPNLRVLVKVTPTLNEYWEYIRGVPIEMEKKKFEAMLGLPTPCYHPPLDKM